MSRPNDSRPSSDRPVRWRLRHTTLTTAARTTVVGVVNVTPDSFSDGGRFFDTGGPATSSAVAHGLRLVADGADVVDVGGESTRPYAEPVDGAEESGRVLPVVEGLVGEGIVVSVDTSKPDVARLAVAAGAEVVNDVTGLRDPEMIEMCAAAGVGVVVMHMQGTPQTMQDDPRYRDVVTDVAHDLAVRAAVAEAGGIERDRICLDPGIGFGKTLEHNLALLAGLDRIVGLGYPVMLGTSRKGFLGTLTGGLPAQERDEATGVTTALAIAAGVAAVRVHDVASARRVAAVADAIVRARRLED